jgi:hypothetical protein
VIAIFNLRGTNLLWAVTRLIEQLASSEKPGAGIQAATLAKDVLLHPMVSHDGILGRRYGAAIREEEIVRVLQDIVRKNPKVKEALPSERLADIKAWFVTVMDRATERFVARTRLATAVFAVLLSFGLSIDALDLFKQISSNAELRARLIQTADATLKLANDQTATEEKGKQIASDALQATHKEKPSIALDVPIDAELRTRAQGRRWIEAHVSDPIGRQDFLKAYDLHYDELRRGSAAGLVDSAEELKAQLAKTDIALVGAPSWPWTWSRQHALGMLMTALFLSLGGPFWFRLLRQVAILRPLLAGKIDASEGKA